MKSLMEPKFLMIRTVKTGIRSVEVNYSNTAISNSLFRTMKEIEIIFNQIRYTKQIRPERAIQLITTPLTKKDLISKRYTYKVNIM